MQGPNSAREHDQHEQAEGKAGDGVVAEDVAGMAQRRAEPGVVPAGAASGRGVGRKRDVAHASILTRGSMTP